MSVLAAAALLSRVDPTDVLLAIIGGGLTLVGIIWTVRGNRQVQRLATEEGAYTRASEIDKGVHERVVAERDYFRTELATERSGRQEDRDRHLKEKAAWAAERADLERRIRELLEEVVDLGRRHGTTDPVDD